jgi:hypothetical protein
MLSKERLLHPATIIALIALMVALSGVGYAATKIGTSQLKNNAVTTPKIKNAAVSRAKVKNNAVNSSKLATGAVRAADLGAGSVGASALANDAVTGAKLASGSVGTNAIATGAVDAAKLGNGSVTGEKLGPNAVTGAKIAGATITAANIAPGQVVTGKGEAVSGRLTLAANTANSLLLSLPGVATVQADCSAAGVAATTVNNISGAPLDATVFGVDAPATAFAQATTIPAGSPQALPNAGAGGVQAATWQLSDAAGRVATVTVALATVGGGCVISGQALVS